MGDRKSVDAGEEHAGRLKNAGEEVQKVFGVEAAAV